MSTFGLGHNSGASPPFDAASDLPRDIPRMHFFKCDIDALWDVLVEMPLELGGFYMRAILAMYRHMEGLPADDDIARMRLGGMDVRTYRRLKAALLARPKCLIVKPSGRVSNERFEEEISAYVTAFKNKREAALERESRKRAEQRNDGAASEVPGKVQAKSGGSPAEVGQMSTNKPSNFGGQKSKIVNEINDWATANGPEKNHSDTRNTVLRARVIRTRGSEDKGESESLPQTQNPVEPLSETGVSDVGKQRQDKRPQLSDLRESGSIKQDADVVMFVYRDDYYLHREEPDDTDFEAHTKWKDRMANASGKAEVILAKHRHGPTGIIELSFQAALTRFSNLAKEANT